MYAMKNEFDAYLETRWKQQFKQSWSSKVETDTQNVIFFEFSKESYRLN